VAHVGVLGKISAFIEALSLELKQLQDPKIKEISEQLEFSDHPKFELIQGLVYRKDPSSICCP